MATWNGVELPTDKDTDLVVELSDGKKVFLGRYTPRPDIGLEFIEYSGVIGTVSASIPLVQSFASSLAAL